MRTDEYIPKRIEELCKKHDISRYRLSQLSGISQTALGHIAHGDSEPTLATLEKICEAFGISMAQFFSEGGSYPDLTKEQKEILEVYSAASPEERKILLNFVRSFRK
ncbi:Helix-turn-helix [Lachnospiraceae bacterium XBB1006]|nr:Helix-turn-helix [Lachnospiraceae bacterium XBB1006]